MGIFICTEDEEPSKIQEERTNIYPTQCSMFISKDLNNVGEAEVRKSICGDEAGCDRTEDPRM